jgi:hypothetical protein
MRRQLLDLTLSRGLPCGSPDIVALAGKQFIRPSAQQLAQLGLRPFGLSQQEPQRRIPGNSMLNGECLLRRKFAEDVCGDSC